MAGEDGRRALAHLRVLDLTRVRAGPTCARVFADFGADVQVRAYDEAVSLAQESLTAATRPTIALVRGTCFGGGIGIALACDLRLARSHARFRIPAGRLGLGYGLGSVGDLVREIGMQAAADVLFSAETFGAERAVEDGLVRRSFEPAAFDAATSGIIDTMTANAPLTLRAVKLALQELKKPTAERDHARVANAVADCFASCDYLEGRQAFAEGRDPVFKGR